MDRASHKSQNIVSNSGRTYKRIKSIAKGPILFIWPYLEAEDPARISDRDNSDKAEVDSLRNCKFPNDRQVLLEEVRRLAEQEEERKRTAETKAFYFLLLAAALIPLIPAVLGTALDGKSSEAPLWPAIFIVVFIVAYLLRFALLAIDAISVSNYHRLSSTDLVAAWNHLDSPILHLIRKILLITQKNREAINRKVTSVKMAQQFLLRVLFSFSFLVIYEAVWAIAPMFHQPEVTP